MCLLQQSCHMLAMIQTLLIITILLSCVSDLWCVAHMPGNTWCGSLLHASSRVVIGVLCDCVGDHCFVALVSCVIVWLSMLKWLDVVSHHARHVLYTLFCFGQAHAGQQLGWE